jgi:hypothetical protein
MKSKQLRILGMAVLVLLATASLAHAQATRTWVSGVGDDANPCSRTAPCKTFAGAISKTAPCGEIDVLDPGGFGALTITKCISIEADGVIAGVLVSGTNGFIISAGAGDNIMIRGLTFDGLGTGLAGIKINTAGRVKIENCFINDFTGFGIDFEPTNAGAALFVENTEIRNTGNFSLNTGGAILVAPSPVSGVFGTLNNVGMVGNVQGLRVQDGGQVMVKSGEAAGNKFSGYSVVTTGATAGTLFLDHSFASSNGSNGFQANGSAATGRMTDSSFTNNGTGISVVNSALMQSITNNMITGNTTDISGTITGIPPH